MDALNIGFESSARGYSPEMPEESATPDLVELTRRMYDAAAETWSPGEQAAWFTRFFAPDVVWESVGLGTTFEGVEAGRELTKDWMVRFEDYEVDVVEIVDLGSGVVFAKSGHAGRQVGSPAHIRLPREVLVHTFVREHGMISRVVSSGDTPEARAAAERLAEERR